MPRLNQRIARFYDETSALWLEVWGDHMHHGWYGPEGRDRDKSRRTAQVDLIERLLSFAEVDDAAAPRRILDAGCGVGGSARYLAGRYGAQVLGLTLSSYQATEGQRRAEAEGAGDLVELRAQDIYALRDDRGFDLVWSLESAEHMPDKSRLLDHFYSLLRPGGRLALVTWCHRATPPALDSRERSRLQRIADRYHLPPWVPAQDYLDAAAASGFRDIRYADWSQAVAPFWGEVIRSALSVDSIIGLLRSGPSAIQGAWAMRDMQAGFRSGLIEYVAVTARKPATG